MAIWFSRDTFNYIGQSLDGSFVDLALIWKMGNLQVKLKVPLVVRLEGTNVDVGKTILKVR